MQMSNIERIYPYCPIYKCYCKLDECEGFIRNRLYTKQEREMLLAADDPSPLISAYSDKSYCKWLRCDIAVELVLEE